MCVSTAGGVDMTHFIKYKMIALVVSKIKVVVVGAVVVVGSLLSSSGSRSSGSRIMFLVSSGSRSRTRG